jgi:hypothetical protein
MGVRVGEYQAFGGGFKRFRFLLEWKMRDRYSLDLVFNIVFRPFGNLPEEYGAVGRGRKVEYEIYESRGPYIVATELRVLHIERSGEIDVSYEKRGGREYEEKREGALSLYYPFVV